MRFQVCRAERDVPGLWRGSALKTTIISVLFLAALFILSCEKDLTGIGFTAHEWNFSTPEAQGVNAEILDSAFIQAKSKGYIDGLLVIRNGSIIAGQYFNRHTNV